MFDAAAALGGRTDSWSAVCGGMRPQNGAALNGPSLRAGVFDPDSRSVSVAAGGRVQDRNDMLAPTPSPASMSAKVPRPRLRTRRQAAARHQRPRRDRGAERGLRRRGASRVALEAIRPTPGPDRHTVAEGFEVGSPTRARSAPSAPPRAHRQDRPAGRFHTHRHPRFRRPIEQAQKDNSPAANHTY